jgi:hypothetical protein
MLPRGVAAPDDALGRQHTAFATRVPSRLRDPSVMFLKQNAIQRCAFRLGHTTPAHLRPILQMVCHSPLIHSTSRLSAGRQSRTRSAPYSWLSSADVFFLLAGGQRKACARRPSIVRVLSCFTVPRSFFFWRPLAPELTLSHFRTEALRRNAMPRRSVWIGLNGNAAPPAIESLTVNMARS